MNTIRQKLPETLLLIIYALLFDCYLIAGEWFKTLKARKGRKKRGRKQRALNWKVNATIREAIWTKLGYKVKRYSIHTRRVWPRGSSRVPVLWQGGGGLQIARTSPASEPVWPLVLLHAS